MGYKTYREENVKNLSQFDRAFKPWKKWQNVKLSDVCPCDTCDVEKERMARKYEFMMSEGADKKLAKKCLCCIDALNWQMECIEKLRWYEGEIEYAEWCYDPNGMDWGLGAWLCSKCHTKNDNLGGSKDINPYMFSGSKFCPQCGAVMKPKENN